MRRSVHILTVCISLLTFGLLIWLRHHPTVWLWLVIFIASFLAFVWNYKQYVKTHPDEPNLGTVYSNLAKNLPKDVAVVMCGCAFMFLVLGLIAVIFS